MRVAKAIVLTDEERVTLAKWARGRSTPARLVQRAKIILAAAEGRENKDIARELGCGRRTVGTWRNRFVTDRMAGIEHDAPRGGRTPTQRARCEAEIIRRTTQETPPNATQWSTRSLAEAVGASKDTVQRVWQDNGLKPHRTKGFKVSNDPKFAEKLVDIVGLYLDPPEHALVLSCDEKSQIQALDRTQKSLPLFPGRLKTLTHDYKRNGTTTLFAAIELAEGKIISDCLPRHRHQEWIKFLKQIDAETPPELDLHLIVDNAQASQGTVVAQAASAVPSALHADLEFVAERDRTLVPRPDAAPNSQRCLPQRGRTGTGDSRLYRSSQCAPEVIRVDQESRRHSRKSHPRTQRPE
jgi:transposase